MAELAANAVGAEPVFPKTITSFLAETFSDLHTHQFMCPVCKATPLSIWTVALFREILAKFSFMLKGISLMGLFLFASFAAAVGIGRAV